MVHTRLPERRQPDGRNIAGTENSVGAGPMSAHRRASRLADTVVSADRGTSSKSPRFIRRWRRFGDFPAIWFCRMGRQGTRALPYRAFYRWCGASGQGRTLPLRTFYRQAHRRGGALPRPSTSANPSHGVIARRPAGPTWQSASPIAAERTFLMRSAAIRLPAHHQSMYLVTRSGLVVWVWAGGLLQRSQLSALRQAAFQSRMGAFPTIQPRAW